MRFPEYQFLLREQTGRTLNLGTLKMKEKTPMKEIRDWWSDTAAQHAENVIPKMEEYGSRDLVDIGRELLSIAGREYITDLDAYEAGVFFYVRGKVARWSNAVERDSLVSEDTLDDIIIYCMMVLHNREIEDNK